MPTMDLRKIANFSTTMSYGSWRRTRNGSKLADYLIASSFTKRIKPIIYNISSFMLILLDSLVLLHPMRLRLPPPWIFTTDSYLYIYIGIDCTRTHDEFIKIHNLWLGIIWTSTWQILSLLSAPDGCAYQLHQIKLPNIGFISKFVSRTEASTTAVKWWRQRRTIDSIRLDWYQVAIQREKKLITHVSGDLVWNIGTKIIIGTNIADFFSTVRAEGNPEMPFAVMWHGIRFIDLLRFAWCGGMSKRHRRRIFAWRSSKWKLNRMQIKWIRIK